MTLLSLVALVGAHAMLNTMAEKPQDFAYGADLSFARHHESQGRVFYDGDKAKPVLQIYRDHGHNWIRLRAFVEPVKDGLPNGLDYTIAMAKDAKRLGFKFLLDFHYSQTWADPGHQPCPDAWLPLTDQERTQKVQSYTAETVAAFRQAGVLPEMVQVGNEVRVGMMWPSGKLPAHWDTFAGYVKAGIAGVREGAGKGRQPRIMVHYDNGADWKGAEQFWDKLFSYGITLDVVGYSYYPWWHGTLAQMKECFDGTARKYGKEVWAVETAYHMAASPETRGQKMPFPETPEGQASFLRSVAQAVKEVPGGLGTGVFWWEPTLAEISTRGCFDPKGKALPAVYAFEK
ncbi:MAG: glycosyl hydrolase 53 family protein [Armatimonadetes bacterium]|nr:glycosyl hydrolase 53 family protein [Armatimonadota bacterium]